MLSIHIHNDGTGVNGNANYDYKVFINDEVIASGRVEGHRRSDGWANLLYRVYRVELAKKYAALCDSNSDLSTKPGDIEQDNTQ
jgi:hypothetical protein